MLDFGINNKIAVITGGTSGIGYSCVEALSKEGAHVVGIGLQHTMEAENKFRSNKENHIYNVSFVQCDLKNYTEVNNLIDRVIEKHKKIDILINCAGAAKAGDFLELTDSDFLDAIQLKLLGYIRMIRKVIPYMKKNRKGSIVNIAGTAGIKPNSELIPAGVVNAGIINLTKGLSRELAQSNVRINCISPGPTKTNRAVMLAEQQGRARNISPEKILAETEKSIPLGRMSYPNEIAELVLFLTSEMSNNITGVNYLIDGGMSS